MNALEKLVEIASPALNPAGFQPAALAGLGTARELEQLQSLLQLKDGFYAFEGALHVFPTTGNSGATFLGAWNDATAWRADYQGMADGGVFFAEDIFGVQFVIEENAVSTFNPETGGMKPIAGTIEEWAAAVLANFNRLTGYSLAHAWQVANGPLPKGTRLVPKMPFVLGGAYKIENLKAVDAVKGMKFRASIAVQIKDLPDGASVKLTTID